MNFKSHSRGRSSPMKNQTIIIEQEDSLLMESQIKQFLSTEQNQKSSISTSNKLKISKQHFINKKSSLARLSSTSFDSILKPRINSFKLKTTSQIYPQNELHFSQFKLQENFKSIKSNMNPIKPFKNTVFKKIQTNKINDNISHLIQNRKPWSAQLLKKQTKQRIKSQNQSFSKQKDLSKSFISTKTNPKTPKKTIVKQELLRKISTSTWLNLNPQKKKESLICLSQRDKNDRKQFLSLEKSFRTKENHVKSLNKFISLGQAKSQRLLSKNKEKISGIQIIKTNLSSKQLVNKKILQKKIQQEMILQKKGLIAKNPFKSINFNKLQILKNPYSEFI